MFSLFLNLLNSHRYHFKDGLRRSSSYSLLPFYYGCSLPTAGNIGSGKITREIDMCAATSTMSRSLIH